MKNNWRVYSNKLRVASTRKNRAEKNWHAMVWKWQELLSIFKYIFAKTRLFFQNSRPSVNPARRVWFLHVEVWFWHVRGCFYTQSVISTRTSVISTLKMWFISFASKRLNRLSWTLNLIRKKIHPTLFKKKT
jgi:hypothetical protein